MDECVQMILAASTSEAVPLPDPFPKKVAVQKITYSHRIRSSIVNGHVAGGINPTRIGDTSFQFVYYLADGASALNVTNVPISTNLTTISLPGKALFTYYNWGRLIALEYTLTPVQNDYNNSGELVISLLSENLLVLTATGTNAYQSMKDALFSASGRAKGSFRGIWLPQDPTDFEFRITNDTGDADKTGTWSQLQFCGIGFPPDTEVFTLDVTVVYEAIVRLTIMDQIPQLLSPAGDTTEILLRIKEAVYSNLALVCYATNPF